MSAATRSPGSCASKAERPSRRGARAPALPLPWIAAAVCGAALLLDGTLRDRVPYLATLHYATPLPAIALVAMLGMAVGVVRERLAGAAACGLVIVVAVTLHRHASWREDAGEPARGDDSVRVALWNVWRQSDHPERQIDEALRFDADVLVFVEPLRDAVADEVLDLRPLLPGHDVTIVADTFVVAVRDGTARADGGRDVGDASMATVEVELSRPRGLRELTLVCVDVRSDPLTPRGPTLRALARAARPYAATPALVLGDFNTPRRSVHMDALRADWRNAFEEAGCGFDLTWPEPLPVHAIDHVFVSPALRTLAFRTRGTRLSDHRPVVVDVRRTAPGPQRRQSDR